MTLHQEQSAMEAVIRSVMDRAEEDRDAMCARMALRLISCDWTGKTLTLAMDPARWMSNPMGVMHGGVVAGLLDTTMGTLSCACTGGARRTPTVTLQTTYLRPVPLDRPLRARASLTHAGRTLVSLTAELWAEGEEDRLLATAAGTFFHAD